MVQVHSQGKKLIDIPTLIIISASADLFSTFLHEMAGHGLNCVLTGGRVQDLGAFYVNCDYHGMTDLAIRWVAFAGPLFSLLTGLVSFLILRRISERSPHQRLFFWLLGTLSFMTAAGYLLFSGISGLGDFGTSRDGVLYQLSPEWLWRLLETLAGAAAYFGVVVLSAGQMDGMIGGSGLDRIRRARGIGLIAYLSGAAASILISLLNPLGIVIILTSAAAASLGGTSGLLWMMQLLNRQKETTAPPLLLPRSRGWIAAGLVFIVIYAAVFGPTLHL
jgi:hypothetical protein